MNLNCKTQLCYKIIKQKINQAKEYRVTEEDQDQDKTVAKGWGAWWNETQYKGRRRL